MGIPSETAQKLVNEALKLSDEDREAVAEALFESLPAEEVPFDDELLASALRRSERMRRGEVKGLTVEELKAKVRGTLAKR